MSVVEETAKRITKLMKLNLKIKSLKIFKLEEQNYFAELHKPIEKIEEFTPKSKIFFEADIEHKEVGRCRLILKGRVDKDGRIDFVHSEMPTIPTEPDYIEMDNKLRERATEFFKEYQSYIVTVLNAIINIAIAIIKKMAERK